MEGCVQMNPVYGLKFPPKAGIKPEIARSAGWRLTEAPFREQIRHKMH